MEKIEIYSSKKKVFLMTLGSMAFVAMGIFVISNRSTPQHIIMGTICTSFFAIGVVLGMIQLFKSKLLLTIENEGITFGKKKQLIKWVDISGFSEISVKSTKIIIIKVRNPEKYIEMETNKIYKKLMRWNLSNTGSLFNFSASTTKYKHTELLNLLKKHWKDNK